MEQVMIDGKATTYFITEDGRLFNQKTKRWYKGTVRGGYLSYDLTVDNKRHSKQAHRLVAETFIPNPDNLPIVNHKDGNKLNNSVDNLEWVTPTQNLNHAYATGLKPRTNGNNSRIKYEQNLEDEIWKPYKDTVYMISNKGRARSTKTNNLMKGKLRRDGYIEWCLTIDGKKGSYIAHRLVYETFCGPIDQDLVINHIDGDKTNNQLDNLEMITKSENTLHGYYTLKTCKKIRKVGKYTPDGKLLQVYPSCAEAARQNTNCTSNNIVNVCNGKHKTHGGYMWKYIDEE